MIPQFDASLKLTHLNEMYKKTGIFERNFHADRMSKRQNWNRRIQVDISWIVVRVLFVSDIIDSVQRSDHTIDDYLIR